MIKDTTNKLKRNAPLSIQFWRQYGTPMMTITTKKGDIDYSADMFIFGRALAQNELLSEKDRHAFRNFCESYINEYQRIKDEILHANERHNPRKL